MLRADFTFGLTAASRSRPPAVDDANPFGQTHNNAMSKADLKSGGGRIEAQ
jgi:hypothetical protein